MSWIIRLRGTNLRTSGDFRSENLSLSIGLLLTVIYRPHMIQPMLCFRMLLGHFYQLLSLFLILWVNRSFPQHFGHTISRQAGHGFKTPLIISRHFSSRIMDDLWPLGHLYWPRSRKNISRNSPWKTSG